MEITEIKFRRFPAQGRLRALVSVTFDGVFAVHDIKVIAGDDHLFLAMPARRAQDGRCTRSARSCGRSLSAGCWQSTAA